MSRPSAYVPVKRALDIATATAGILITAPVMGIVAGLVRYRLGSPVIFKQDRPGKDSKIFTLYKFRTMKDTDPELGLLTDEDRLTSFGKTLRSTSLDELPSLINVLKGEMSIVGPRPLLLEYLDLYTPEQARRHEVRPGITGLAQVSGRNELEWERKFDLDVEYVDTQSFWLDANILARTVSTLLRRTGISNAAHATMYRFEGSNEA